MTYYVSGDFPYCTPRMPIRGYDAVSRAPPDALRWYSNSPQGAGSIAGNYGPQGPSVFAPIQAQRVNNVFGAGSPALSNGSAGNLLSPLYLIEALTRRGQ
jgi:hypothetical protein